MSHEATTPAEGAAGSEQATNAGRWGPFSVVLDRRQDSEMESLFSMTGPLYLDTLPGRPKQRIDVLRTLRRSQVVGALVEAWAQGKSARVWLDHPLLAAPTMAGKSASVVRVELDYTPGQ